MKAPLSLSFTPLLGVLGGPENWKFKRIPKGNSFKKHNSKNSAGILSFILNSSFPARGAL